MTVQDDLTMVAGLIRRWSATADQVLASVAAAREHRPELANAVAEIEERREHLARQPEAIIGADDSLWSNFLGRGVSVARAVGRVIGPNGQSQPVGTGVLVGPALLLTNQHVLETAELAAGMSVEFDHEYAENGTLRTSVVRDLDPQRCFWSDEEADFTVVAVADLADGRPPGERYGVIPLIERPGKVLLGECLNVVHHPGGAPKRISIRENRLVAQDDLWLRYRSDTRPGSSGSPVFNDQWELVALHHAAVPAGAAGLPGGNGGDFAANEGVRTSRIVARLRVADLLPGARVMVDEALAIGAAL
jgi:V8-like Glu-specific endopeptidase